MDWRMVGAGLAALILLASASAYVLIPRDAGPCPRPAQMEVGSITKLPDPRRGGGPSLEEALLWRRSIREYSGEPLTIQEISQLLWAAQGITDPRGLRTAPSAGGTYPLEIYIVVGKVEGLSAGVYKYRPHDHSIAMIREGDKRAELAEAALGQGWVRAAAIDIVISADYGRTTARYGERGVRYVHMEAGHAAQNLLLQAAALGLGAVPVGAFDDDKIAAIIGSPPSERPLYV
ncbi:MAG: SagB/ThcOx family dehydrogenase, partial [Candidatus Bathyarchaeia archaeon]